MDFDEKANGLQYPLIQEKSEPPKKIIVDLTICSLVAWALANFFYGLLDDHDFPTSCLQFTGFILVCLVSKGV